MNSIIKLFLACCLVVFCDTSLFAQDDLDSVEVVKEFTSPDSLPPDNLPPESLGDTVLNKYEFEPHDLVQEYKADRDFAYMRYLDSILRKTKDLTVDTFSIGDAISSRGKEVRQSSRRVNVPGVNIFSNPVVKIILWVLAVFLIGFIIYKLFLGENFFRRDRRYKSISDSHAEDDLSDPSVYEKLVAQAVMNKDYRLAIRYLYLQTLRKLSGSGLLQFAADKTNYQYVNELRGKPYQNDFAAITLHYEYVWYGKFDIGEEVYRRLSGEYRSFHQKI